VALLLRIKDIASVKKIARYAEKPTPNTSKVGVSLQKVGALPALKGVLQLLRKSYAEARVWIVA
jgi:hypothetical protein